MDAIAFPGMGPTEFGTVAKYMLVDRHARDLVAEADDVLCLDLFAALRDSSSDYSMAAQVAFLVNCLACARWASSELGVEASYCAGPSFGGKAAAAWSGALSTRDAVRLTAELFRIESDYFSREHSDVRTLSFMRTPRAKLDEIRSELDDLGEWHEISCHVDEDLWMVSLKESRLEWMRKRLRAAGGMPVYVMDPPMHVSTFGPLRDRVLAEVFGSLEFRDPTIPVVADQDGTVRDTADGVRRMLLDGFVRPVQWPSVVATLAGAGVTRLCMAGPDALFGRVRVTTQAFTVAPANPRLALRPYRRPALAA